MPLITTQKMLTDAQNGGYAVGAFNIENMETVLAVITAAEEVKAPVILQTTPSTARYADLDMFFAMVKTAAEKAEVPVALHFDHGNSFELVKNALLAGYTSVMIDGSHHDFEENIALTKRVTEIAGDIPVEAELGKVGGKEDDLEAEADGNTDSAEAAEFVKRTGISSLAVAIGTAHGFYAAEPKLDKERLSEIKKAVEIPLVLHGASGLSDEDVGDCVKRGICKVNFATELRVAFTGGIKETLKNNPEAYDPKVLGKAGMNKVKQLVINKIAVCCCGGKA